MGRYVTSFTMDSTSFNYKYGFGSQPSEMAWVLEQILDVGDVGIYSGTNGQGDLINLRNSEEVQKRILDAIEDDSYTEVAMGNPGETREMLEDLLAWMKDSEDEEWVWLWSEN